MSLPENNEISINSVLNDDELLELFNYVDFCTLKQCRLVCQHWRILIEDSPKLMNRFGFDLIVGPGTALDIDQVPLSIVARSVIKIKKLTFVGNYFKIYLNREILDKLFEILSEEQLESVTDLAIDREQVKADLFFEYMQRFKNLKSVQLPLEIFDSVFEKFESLKIETVETLTINFEYFLDNQSQLLHNALQIFPNTREIHIKLRYQGDSTNIEELMRVVEAHESKIKSVSNLTVNLGNSHHKNLLIDLHNFPNMREISLDDIRNPQNELNAFFDRPFQLITELRIREPEELENLRFLRLMPNLRKLELSYSPSTHFFGHELIELRKLEEVELISIQSDCNECWETMFRSFIQIKKLKIILFDVGLERIASILQNYNLEELFCEFRYLRFFRKPTLKSIILRDVGPLNENSIKALSRDCPLLESIRLRDICDSNMKELVRSVVTHFPNIKHLDLLDGRFKKIENLSEVFTNRNGWRLQKLLVSRYLDHEDILQIFQKLHFLQELQFCGLRLVTRRIYHEVDVLKQCTLAEKLKKY